MILRELEKSTAKRLADHKAIIIMGARQVGKSTLVSNMRSQMNGPIQYWTGDDADIRQLLRALTSSRLKQLVDNAGTLIINEAQRIENIGICIKLIVDNYSDIKVIATGSSSFDLANKINEPLTGRKWEYQLYPLAFSELVQHHGLLEESRMLKHRLKYINYAAIYTSRYFWRTHAQQEIDYVEDRGGKLYAYEFKWNLKARASFSKTFIESYQPAETLVITPDNFYGFIGGDELD